MNASLRGIWRRPTTMATPWPPLRAAALVMLAVAAVAKPLSSAECVGSAMVGLTERTHCICLAGLRCTGAHCTSGHRGVGPAREVVSGYNPSRCADCKCGPDPEVIDAVDHIGHRVPSAGQPQHAHAGEDQLIFKPCYVPTPVYLPAHAVYKQS